MPSFVLLNQNTTRHETSMENFAFAFAIAQCEQALSITISTGISVQNILAVAKAVPR